MTEVAGALETFIKQRPLPENPKKKGKVTVDDAALSLVRFANGALGSIEGTRFAAGRKNYNRFEINGSKGSVAFDLERMNELEFYSREDDGQAAGLPPHHGHRAAATPTSRRWWPAGPHHRLRAHLHRTRSTTSSKRSRAASACSPTSRTASATSSCSRRSRRRARTKRWVSVGAP